MRAASPTDPEYTSTAFSSGSQLLCARIPATPSPDQPQSPAGRNADSWLEFSVFCLLRFGSGSHDSPSKVAQVFEARPETSKVVRAETKSVCKVAARPSCR